MLDSETVVSVSESAISDSETALSDSELIVLDSKTVVLDFRLDHGGRESKTALWKTEKAVLESVPYIVSPVP